MKTERKKWVLVPNNISKNFLPLHHHHSHVNKMEVKPPINYWVVNEFIIDCTAQITESYQDLKQMKCKLKTSSSYTTLT